jgi:myo-inositol-1(or 4)-monophosphatase
MEGWRSGFTIERKGPIDLVTHYDRASEDLVRSRFAQCFRNVDVVAEERPNTLRGTPRVLYADPLDGTTNFAHGHPFFCVSLALYEAAQPLAAAVVAPALGVEYRAARGHGTTRNGRSCRVSGTQVLGDALLATGFAYDNARSDENNFREFCALTRRTRGVRRCGSAALDLCFVADGTYDGYWESRLKPWDLAAGVLCVAEAGGVVTALDGGDCDVRRGSALATNGTLHGVLRAALDDAGSHRAVVV